MKFRSQLESTRFFYIQEGIAIGVLASVAKTFFPSFPILELFGFTGPMITIAFGLKTWGGIKENGAKSKENGETPTR